MYSLTAGKLAISAIIQRLFTTTVTLLLVWQLPAQLPDYHLQLFDYTAGLRPGTIEAVTKDQKGFLWILYPRSVQRFDGRRAVSYKAGNGMTNIHCDEQGRVWVSSSGKVYRFDEDGQQFKAVRVKSPDTAYATGAVFSMPGKRTLLNATSGFFEYDGSIDQFVPSLKELPVPPGYGTRSFGCKGAAIFFGHKGYVYRYNTASKKLDSLPDRSMRRIFPLNEDSVLINTWSLRTYWYNFSAGTIHEAKPPASLRNKAASDAFATRSMVEVGPQRYIITSAEGVFEYQASTRQYKSLNLYYKGNPVLTGDIANSVYADKEGYVWMSTVDGIARFPLHGQSFGLMRIPFMNDVSQANGNNIRNITEDDKGNLWLATGNGFVCWNRKTNQWINYPPVEGSKDRLAYPSVRGIVYDGRYIILGPADLGVWLFDPVTKKYKRPVYASDKVEAMNLRDFVDDVYTLHNGKHLITGRDALYVLDGKTYRLDTLDNPAGKENSNYVFQGNDGWIWITTVHGLHLLDSNLVYQQKATLPTGSSPVSAGFMLQDGRLLFAIDKGLFTAEVKGNSIRVKKFTTVFDEVFITSLFMDDQGFIWATSDNGIYRYDSLHARLNLFDHSDNVQGYGFNLNSWHKSRDAVLFMGGINGLNYLQPEKFATRTDSLRVYIQQVKSSSNDSLIYRLDRKAILSFSQRSLEAEFVSPYYNNPEKLKYRYRLEGLDKDWKYLGNTNSVRFTSLPAGDYTLLVEASINNVDWTPAASSFSFTIKKPFWLQLWFLAVLLISIGTVLWLFIRNRNRKIAEKQEELEAEQAINYFSSSIADQQSVDGILWDVAKNCIGRLGFEDCVIYLLDEERNVLQQKAAHGPKNPGRFEIIEPIEIPVGKGITGTVAATGKAELINDTSKDERYIIDGTRRFSEIAVPVIVNSKVIGVIDCEHSKKGFFTQRHLSVLSTIASLCAGKIIKAKAEAEKTEAERILMDTQQKMADVEMQALRAQMNPHFIFNCLNSINRYIVKSDQATASLYLTRFAKLIRLILDNSNSKTVTLTNELEALRLYIEMESIRFEKQFSYTIRVDDSVHPDSIYVPPLIIQPYVENAIWHGLLHKESAGHLLVHICCGSKSVLECIVEDNGVGRDKAKELKSKSASNKKSLGMKLTEDRLALLNKKAELNASVEIIDLKNETGEAAGTRVILKIPVDG